MPEKPRKKRWVPILIGKPRKYDSHAFARLKTHEQEVGVPEQEKIARGIKLYSEDLGPHLHKECDGLGIELFLKVVPSLGLAKRRLFDKKTLRELGTIDFHKGIIEFEVYHSLFGGRRVKFSELYKKLLTEKND